MSGPKPIPFWDRVDKNGPVPEHRPELGACWLWTGAKSSDGYGSVRINGQSVGAHKFAFLDAGGMLDEGKEVCHHCDVRPCVRPIHLFQDTHLGNIRDMHAKGRARKATGDANGSRRHPESRPRWTDEQRRLVESRAGKMPASMLLVRINAAGPERTSSALSCYATHRGIALRPSQAGRATREPESRRSGWTPPEDRVLRDLAGQQDAGQIAERINARYLTQRTRHSVRNRAGVLGVSLVLVGLLSQKDLCQIFPVHNRRVERWSVTGLLRAERRGTGRHGSAWWYRPTDVEAFVRAHPHLFDWRRVQAGRWRDLVRSVAIRDPWLSVEAVSALVGVRPATLHVWLASGLVLGARRAGEHRSAPWRIQSSALEGVERMALRLGHTGLETAS